MICIQQSTLFDHGRKVAFLQKSDIFLCIVSQIPILTEVPYVVLCISVFYSSGFMVS